MVLPPRAAMPGGAHVGSADDAPDSPVLTDDMLTPVEQQHAEDGSKENGDRQHSESGTPGGNKPPGEHLHNREDCQHHPGLPSSAPRERITLRVGATVPSRQPGPYPGHR